MGELVKRITSKIGVKPCKGCKGRAKWMDDHLPIRVRVTPKGKT